MAKTTARTFHTQQVHYLRKTVNYNDNAVSAGVYVGTLPSGAQILDAVVQVATAFNAGSGNTLGVGITSTAYVDIIATGDVTLGTTGGYRAAILTAGDIMATDSDVYARYVQTGSTASAGAATITITFAANNDG